MRWLFIPIFCINLYAIEYNSNISYDFISYNKFSNESVIKADSKIKYENEFYTLNTSLEYLYSDEYKKRRYLDINELYLSKEDSSSNLVFGKQIKYWGELEAYNITDIFNQKKYINDPFNKDKKIASYTLNDTFYLDESSLEIGAKFYEEDKKYPKQDEPFYPFSLKYDESLKTSHSKNRASIYLKYDFSTEIIESENKLIFWYGYDVKRAISLNNQNLRQEAYLVNKLLYLSNIIYEDYIFKFEFVLSDVKTNILSDYAQIALGVERSVYDIKGADIAFYLEYYKYKYFNKLQENIDIAETYDDDLFFAIKINLNDTDNSEIKTGILYDRRTSERVFKTQISTRLKDAFVFNGEILNIEAKENSVLTSFNKTTRVSLGLKYSF